MGNCMQTGLVLEADDNWKIEILKASAVAPASPEKQPVYRIPKEPKCLRVYGDPMCPLTMQVLLALRHKEIQYDCSWFENDKKEAKLDWSARNGSAAVIPSLQHGGERISGRTDILLQYIDSAFPEHRLVPKGEIGKRVREWAAFMRDTLSPLVSQLLYDGEPSIQEELQPELDLALSKVNAAISKFSNSGPYFFGSIFTLADVVLIPIMAFTHPLKHFRDLELPSMYQFLVQYRKVMVSFPVCIAARVTPESLQLYVANKLEHRAPPPLLILMLMQHRSMMWHFERLVSLADSLAANPESKCLTPTRGLSRTIESPLKGRTTESPIKIRTIESPLKGRTIESPLKGRTIGSPLRGRTTESPLKKLWKGYGRLLELMQEHAQMEERVMFPTLEQYDEGVTEDANADHGRDLPLTNGIKEDLKGLLALDEGTPDYKEAVRALAKRLRTLQLHTQEHFQQEEREFLPLLDSPAFGATQAEAQAFVTHCLGVMESTHAHLLPFLLAGLNPHDIYQYLMVLHRNLWDSKPAHFTRMLHVIEHADKEFQSVKSLVQEKFSEFPPFRDVVAET